MTFLSAFTSFVVLLLLTVYNVECSLSLNFDGSSSTGLFLDVGHLNHSKEYLFNAQSNVRFFALLEPNKQVSLKSSFGPISVRETIYPNAIQDALLTSRSNNQHKIPLFEHHTNDDINASVLPANSAELTAHLVSTTIYRNSPQFRILFQSNIESNHQTSLTDLNNVDHTDHANHLEHGKHEHHENSSTNSTEHHQCAIAIVKFNAPESDKNSKSTNDFKPLIASCALNKDGVCISEITIPANWWPAVNLDASPVGTGEQSKQSQQANTKSKPGSAEVYYTAVYSDKCGEISKLNTKTKLREHVDAMSKLNLQHNNLHIENAGKISLKPFEGNYEELTNDDIIRILIPQKSVNAKTRLHIPVCYRYHRNYPLFAFALRVRVKPGMRILGAKLARKSQPNLQPLTTSTTSRFSKRKQNRLMNEYNKLNSAQNWEISLESNSKQTQATITAFLKLNNKDQLVNEEKQVKTEDAEDNDEDDDLDDDLEEFDEDLMNLMPSTCNEVYTILLEVDEKAVEFSDAGRIVWQLLYLTDLENTNQNGENDKKRHLKHDFDRESSKLTSKLDIQKDEVDTVLALTKSRNLLNTAILTGKQNIQPLKIYVVEKSGKFGDVTLQTSCSSNDETVLKVSPSCTALYLDGSETRSSINATISIHYSTFNGVSSFQVWMPKLPIELDVSDDQLSAVHSWKIPHLKQQSVHAGKTGHRVRNHPVGHAHGHHNQNGNGKHHNHNHHKHNNENQEKQTDSAEMGCRLRYQQAYIEAYAKFILEDENSGREWSFLNRKYSFRVTDLILPHLHLSDNRLAIVRSNTIEGLNPGTVELKILSPITGKQLASKKIRVTLDQETITGLQVKLLTGLQMQIRPEHTILDQPLIGHSVNHLSSSSVNNPQVTLWSVKTTENSVLTTQYQEGLLDIEIKFSDGKTVSLSDITDSDYHLQIDSGNGGMIAYAPGLSASLPRIIALKSGHNIKLDVSLQTPVQCTKKNSLPLQQQTVYLSVNLNSNNQKVQTISQHHQHNETSNKANNDHNRHITAENLDSTDNQRDNTNLQNDERMLPTDQKQQFHSLYNSQLSVSQRNKLIRPLNSDESSSGSSWNGVDIGVYTVLCVCGVLMAIFTTSCFVYAFKQKNNGKPSEFTTVTTVKQNDQDDSGFGGDLLNTNAMRLNKIVNEWPWLQQQANKFVTNNRSDDDENQISGYDENGNPIITNKVNVRSNPFDNEPDDDEGRFSKSADNKNRQSIISYPGSEISIQITANPIVNAIENVAKNALNKIREDKKDKQLQEIPTPEPDLQEIKSMLNYCKSIPLKQKTQQAPLKINKQPPPIPPRRNQQTNSATFVRGKRAPNQQLPVHVPGIACRTLNAPNFTTTNNSVNSSPTSSKNSPTLSPSLSLSSTDSGIQNEFKIDDLPINEEKYIITNPFLNEQDDLDELADLNELNEIMNKEEELKKLKMVSNAIPLTRTFGRQPPSYFDEANDETIYINTTGPAVPKHNSTTSTETDQTSSMQQKQRIRIIPPRSSLFDEMNYNEIVNYIENMEESTA